MQRITNTMEQRIKELEERVAVLEAMLLEKKVKAKKEPTMNMGYPNIAITANEVTKLVTEFGKDVTDRAIKYLSEYKVEKAYKTKSDYLSIRRWVISAVSKPTKSQQPSSKVEQAISANEKAKQILNSLYGN